MGPKWLLQFKLAMEPVLGDLSWPVKNNDNSSISEFWYLDMYFNGIVMMFIFQPPAEGSEWRGYSGQDWPSHSDPMGQVLVGVLQTVPGSAAK